MRHLIDFGDLSRAEWDSLYHRCSEIMDHPADFLDACKGRVMASLFYEPSTRTNFSFQTAMLRVGGTVFGFADPRSSSVAKGETLKDTVKMVSGYADVVVMRNPLEGAAKAASLYSNVPVINAGDGGHMHPTQTTADLTTITRLRGGVVGGTVRRPEKWPHGALPHQGHGQIPGCKILSYFPPGAGSTGIYAGIHAGKRDVVHGSHRIGVRHPVP